MNSLAAERVAQMKAAAQNERKLLAELEGRITEHRAKDLLKQAGYSLDEVEEFFLGEKALAKRRAPDQMAAYLDIAEVVLRRAREQRETVQGLVDKFGPDMKGVG